MKCSELKELISAYIDEELPLTQKQFIEEHLAVCGNCRSMMTDYRMVDRQIKSLSPVPQHPAYSADSIMSNIKSVNTRKTAVKWFGPAFIAVPIAMLIFAMLVTSAPSIENYRNDPTLKVAADVSFNQPAPIGTEVSQLTDLSKLDFGEVTNDQSTLENTDMTVTEIERGAGAYAILQKADPTVAPAPDGFEYIMAKINVSMQAALASTTWIGAIQLHWDLKDADFTCYSSGQYLYPQAYVPNPPTPNMEYTKVLISGQSADTWVVFQVAKTDMHPRMLYSTDQILYWFALYK